MKFNITKTERDFALIEFKDLNNVDCSLQQSSLADYQCIWLGTDTNTGINRMHLTRDMVESLLPYLIRFIVTILITELITAKVNDFMRD